MRILLCSLFFSLVACSSTEPPRVPISTVSDKDAGFVVETLAKDIGGVIWGITQMPKNRMLLSLREGSFKIIDLTTKKVSDVSGGPKVYVNGQGGLLDVTLDPEFAKNSLVYFTYSAINGDKQATRLERAKLVGNKLTEHKILFTASPWLDSENHFGSRIAFDFAGHIYISIGERFKRELAQDLSNHYGKVIRLKMDGSVPSDNPFVNTKNAKPEIWSYGHRNPQGIFFDRKQKKLWINEHGPRGGDEINLVLKGENYAWPLATYGKEYWGPKVSDHVTFPGTQDPRHVWLPSIAPSSLVIYDGDAFPKWQGSFLSGALVLTHLNRVEFEKDKAKAEYRYLTNLGERIRSIELDRPGNIILGTDSGSVLRLSPK